MTHYRMMDCEPSAAILFKNPRTSSLDELKIYENNTIYLDNGNEFQIRLFNPTSYKLGVQIGLNGNFSQSYLVLRPGEDVTIDRFIDDQRKMLFETYTVDASNSAVQRAIANNGLLEIKFFKEKVNQIYFSTFFSNTSSTTSGGFVHTTTTNSKDFLCCDATMDYSSNLEQQSLKSSTFGNVRSKETLKETGRIEKGDVSQQNFDMVNATFETFPYYGIVFNLKPKSEATQEIRNYCGVCGYRLKDKKWSFCPKCGERL